MSATKKNWSIKNIRVVFALFVSMTIAFFFSFANSSYAITITGSETITTNSSASYSAVGCNGTVTWSVTGVGTSISSNGVLTTGSASCGGITVTAKCSDDSIATKTARVTSYGAGQWVETSSCGFVPSGCGAFVGSLVTGKYSYTSWYNAGYPTSCADEFNTACCQSDCPTPFVPTGLPPGYVVCCSYATITSEWQCPACTNGQTLSCYTGAAETKGVGICKAGTQTCVNGQWGACTGEVLPSAEICGNDKDENCDGNKDEGCAVCEDKDGDGYYAYNSVSCPQGNDCNDFDRTIYPGAPEICDEKDNNCDGQKDENCLGDSCSNIQTNSSANPGSGNLYHDQTLFRTTTLGFTLSYNSIDIYNGSLGKGWTHNWNMLLFSNPSDNSIGLKQGDGRVVYFRLNQGVYYPEAGSGETSYITYTNSTYTLTEKNNTTYTFNTSGRLTQIKDRNNNTTTLTSNGDNLTTITDPSGRTTYLTYDSGNKITSITDPSNNIYTFTYNNNNLTQISTPNSQLGTLNWSYSYDANGIMLTKTDPQGYVTTYTYDTNNKVISSQDPEGKIKAITYDPTTSTASVTEKDGGLWTYKYDPLLNVTTKKTDPQGNVTTYTYDTNKNLISTKEPDGSTTSYTYDTNSNMASVTNPLGNTTSYTYNSLGQITSITDSENKITTYTYDAKGNLLSTTDPTGAITQYQYDSKGNITQITNPNSQTTTFTYDQFNNMTSVTDSQGQTTRYAYDSAGNMIAQMDALGNTTEYIYDSLNRLIKLIEPNGIITAYTYDANGNRTSITDGNLNVIQYAYNYKGQLTKVIDPLSDITAYEYGGTGCASCGGGSDKLTAITDAKGNRTTYEYDTLGRLIRETDSLGKTITYTYDSKGNLITKTDSNGNVTNYTYDTLNRLTKKTYPDGTIEEYRYDSRGNIIYAGNQWIAYNFAYDSKGRLLAVTDSNGRIIQYEYDAVGNRTKMITPEGKIVLYKYDANNRLIEISSDGQIFTFIYDNLGRRVKMIYPNGTYTTYNYDKNSRLTELVHKDSKGSVSNSFTYAHDKIGNRLTKTELDKKTSYTYDSLYRLTQALPTKLQGKDKTQINKAESFTYDPVGNRLTGPETKEFYSYNQGNQLTNDRKNQYEYDNNGNLIKKREIDNGTIWLYTYDYENHLIKVIRQESGETVIVSFKYDPFGRRIEKKVTESGITTTKRYFYDNEDILFEYDENGVIGNRYIHGLGIDEPLAMINKQGTFYYHADGLGSIVALTDSSQKVVQTYEYDSFGNLKDQKERIKQPYTFTAREWDKEIGLYSYRPRNYDPMIGRFITYDPIRFSGGDINLYQYAKANPILFTDPFGLTVKLCKRDLNIPIPNSQFFLGEEYHHAFLWINGKTFGLTTDYPRITKRCGIEGSGSIAKDYRPDIEAARTSKMHGSCQEVKCENEENLLKHARDDKAPYYCLSYRNFQGLPPTETIGMNCQDWAEMMIAKYCKCGE